MRRSVAIVGIALAICAAFDPAVALALPLPLLAAHWLIAPPDAAQPRTSEAPAREQRCPLLERSLGRAPSLVPFLA